MNSPSLIEFRVKCSLICNNNIRVKFNVFTAVWRMLSSGMWHCVGLVCSCLLTVVPRSRILPP
jgi:hypothetical protein